MIWALLAPYAYPDEYAVTIRNGEIHIAAKAELEAQKKKVRECPPNPLGKPN